MASAPSTPSSKRELSSSSTPIPSSTSTQPVKKAKIPDKPSKLSSSDVNMQVVIKSVTAALKDTISEQVTTRVEAMAQSVADIISSLLNDRMAAIEIENKYLREQIESLTKKLSDLESGTSAGNIKMDIAVLSPY